MVPRTPPPHRQVTYILDRLPRAQLLKTLLTFVNGAAARPKFGNRTSTPVILLDERNDITYHQYLITRLIRIVRRA